MKRFITYLYEYEKGQKTKNTGFVRVDERNGRVVFQISVRNFIRSHEKGEIYVFVWENGLQAIEIGKLTILNSQTDVRLELDADNIKETGYSLERVVGIGLMFLNNEYMASCWDDAYGDEIGRGRFHKWENKLVTQDQKEAIYEEDMVFKKELVNVEKLNLNGQIVERAEESMETQEYEISYHAPQSTSLQAASYELVAYQKMELNAIKKLPSPNWYLCNNRFLVHGFFNYGYLILKKTTEADGEKAYLGVPGIYEKPEMVMATLFGFSEFQMLPKEVQAAQLEEIVSVSRPEKMKSISWMEDDKRKQPTPKQGDFGCWLIPVQS